MTPQLQLTAADAGRRYGETDTVMCVVINVVTAVQCNLCSAVHTRYSPVTVTSSLVFVGPGPVHESLSLEFFNFNFNIQ